MGKFRYMEGETYSQKAYSYLKKTIIGNQYKPGEPISESVICNQLGMSRTPVREAILKLEKENLVQIYPKRGTFIKAVSPQKLQELFEIREIIEPEAARRVAHIISKSELFEIERQLTEIKNTEPLDETKAVTVGRRLHELILKGLGNNTLIEFLQHLKVEIDRGCNEASGMQGNVLKFLNQHFEIIAALEEENGEKAKRLMTKHLKDARKALLS